MSGPPGPLTPLPWCPRGVVCLPEGQRPLPVSSQSLLQTHEMLSASVPEGTLAVLAACGQARAGGRGSAGTMAASTSEATYSELRLIYEDDSDSLAAAPSGISGRFWSFYFISKSPDCPSP